jgi:hypothetical protein
MKKARFINMLRHLLLSSVTLVLVSAAHGQDAPLIPFKIGPDDAKTSSEPSFKFTTEQEGSVPVYVDNAAEVEPFKAYLGYPRHRLGLIAAPMSVGATWTYGSREYNFRVTSIGYGVVYQFQSTPHFDVQLDYTRYGLEIDAANITPYSIAASKETFEDYFVRTRYCFISSGNFFKQLCPGFEFGNSSYPVLGFTSGTALELGKVQDLVVGFSVNYQRMMTERALFLAKAFFNMGTGLGNSGALTPKTNMLYGVSVGTEYEIRPRHSLTLHGDFHLRQAKLEGKIGNNKDTWETDSSVFGGRLGYMYAF